MKLKYTLGCNVTVSATTVVIASSLEEAMEIAGGRTVELEFNGCGNMPEEVWLIGEGDGSPHDIRVVSIEPKP